ncbi:Biotin transporter BioY2 [Candidatus Clavichlamydia salmonicola]|uniref:biotin transporter BioY n=1 Tax=Candidatus Clavichlamydia salmonicola TaxID=469812 RepID=UPI001891B8B5|nr:biotin transporter BioY [Candidatus Clavichlamydia salmonicola]MBF5051117.1 Biotin transporter BioY2 [Candidatus Clavichlamydia salmonicola]
MYESSFLFLISSRNKISTHIQTFICILGGICLMSLSAHIAIPLWCSVVPLTLQTAMLPLIAWTFGKKKGTSIILFYILQGIMGVPCFAAGASGLAYVVFGPTGGYLAAMPIMAYFIGKFSDKQNKKVSANFLGLLFLMLGTCLTLGSLRLVPMLGWKQAFLSGMLPFILTGAMSNFFVFYFTLARFGKK